MTAKVRLLPSEHEFDVEAGESLLDAALRAGLAIRYSCNSGSCGECRARLVAGQLGALHAHDYVFSQRERAAGQFLMCRAYAAQDLLLEAVEARSAADIPLQKITAQVCKLTRLSEDVMDVHVRTPRSQTLWFLAGQHVRLTLPGALPRNKSIASCPCNGRVLQFHVRYRTQDAFSEQVFQRLKLRDSVEIEGPFGQFVLDETAQRPLLLVAYETGFAPIKSLIEHAISLEIQQPMRLYWLARQAHGHYLANYCRAWHDALDDFDFIPISAAGQDDSGTQVMAQGSARILADHPDLSGFDLYANGPESLFAPLCNAVLAQGLPRERLFVDHIQRY